MTSLDPPPAAVQCRRCGEINPAGHRFCTGCGAHLADGRGPGRRWFSLDRWWLPFLWIILTPIVTVPVSAGLFDLFVGYHTGEEVGIAECSGCLYFEIGPATVMAFALLGLLNLVPFVWLWSRTPRVRIAAVVAGTIGLVRVLIPIAVLMTMDTATSVGGDSYALEWQYLGGHNEPFDSIWEAGGYAWLASLAAPLVFGLVTLAWRQALEGRLSLTLWWLPFLWLMLTPLVTMPVNVAVFENLGEYYNGSDVGLADAPPGQVEGWCPEDDPYGSCIPNFLAATYDYYKVAPMLVAFLTPGLVNLVPFVWSLSKARRTRMAGIVAGIMGLVRVAAPALSLAAMDTVTSPGGTTYFRVETEMFTLQPYISVWGLSFLAWVASGAVWIVFGILTRERRQPTRTGPAGAEPDALALKAAGQH